MWFEGWFIVVLPTFIENLRSYHGCCWWGLGSSWVCKMPGFFMRWAHSGDTSQSSQSSQSWLHTEKPEVTTLVVGILAGYTVTWRVSPFNPYSWERKYTNRNSIIEIVVRRSKLVSKIQNGKIGGFLKWGYLGDPKSSKSLYQTIVLVTWGSTVVRIPYMDYVYVYM